MKDKALNWWNSLNFEEQFYKVIEFAKMNKLPFFQTENVNKGNNTLNLSGLKKYSNGVYVVQLLVNNETLIERLVLIN